MSGRAQLIQRSRQVKRRRKSIQLVGLACLILIAFILTIYALHRPRWRIEEVQIIGAKSINSAAVVDLIKQETSSSYLWLVPKNSRLFYPQKTLTEKISQTFPRVASVKFNKPGGLLQVNITERESELLWCQLGEADQKDCYFVDITGTAFAKAPNFTDHVLFEVYQKNNASSTVTPHTVLGGVVLPPDTLKNIFAQKEVMQKIFANKKIFDRSIITSVELAPDNSYTFDVVSPNLLDQDWQLLTAAKMPPESLANLLVVLLGSSSFDKNVSKGEPTLSYIDTRLANKVFFKVSKSHATSTP